MPGFPEPLTSSEGNALRAVAALDPELAYLALLTIRGVKPLSRWEKALPEAATVQLAPLGLDVQLVARRVERGRITEAVLSRSPDLIRLYRLRFEGEPVAKTSAVARIEGFFFGYPGCCVEAFVREPYRPNDLTDADQRILFHWACPGCPVTPLLVPRYRWAHAIVAEINPAFGSVSTPKRPRS